MTIVFESLRKTPRTWLITGVAGFIGSHLLENLLKLDQKVVGIDNFSTGSRGNLDEVRDLVGDARWRNFNFFEADIRDLSACKKACEGTDFILHQAAIGSVPRSVQDPLFSHENNVNGMLNVLIAARDRGVRRLVYASSSSVYGDHPVLPKVEEVIGNPLSPYALTKSINEQYARVWASVYGLQCIGLRYFNVFGPRQDPNGPYAAVIPRFFSQMIRNEKSVIYGSGESSRDFCYVLNVVQMNLRAALAETPMALNRVYNVGVSDRTTVLGLFNMILDRLRPHYPHLKNYAASFEPARAGDIPHSQADISAAQRLLGYQPEYVISQGLDLALEWYRARFS